MESGELAFMKITAYRKPTYVDGDKIADAEFSVQINPETYAETYEIVYDENQVPGTSKKMPKYGKTKPQTLEFEFMFDSTGAVPGTTDDERENPLSLLEKLDLFKKVTYKFDGESHRPPFLVLAWGSLLFKCVMTSMTITYKLFRPDGTPVRAVVKASFQGLAEDALRVAEENRSSPDLTHVRIVKAGDSLPLLCKQIYGDAKYYLEVAKVNKLIDFRSMAIGTRIEFPPLAKA